MLFIRYAFNCSKNDILIRSLRKMCTAKSNQKSLKMQAWQLHSYGNIEDLQLTYARYPFISKPNEVLIKVKASSVNPLDVHMMSGYGKNVLNILRCYELEFPLTLGRDFSGVVFDKGIGVGDQFKIGDEVYGVIPVQKQGCHSQVVVADKSHILKKPQYLSHIEAASILYTSLTAWSALYIFGGLLFQNVHKCKVLILGASGGVGISAVQILKSQKANVFATCSESALPLVRGLGIDNIFNYRDSNYNANVADVGKFDIILDCANVGYQNIPREWQYEQYITLNSPLLKNIDTHGIAGGLVTSAGSLISSNVKAWFNNKNLKWAYFTITTEGLKFIDNLVKNKQITPIIHKVFQFSETPKAYKQLSDGHARGKIVIDMDTKN